MRHFLEIAQTGLAAVLLHRLRSLVCVAALVAVLLPYLAGLALAKGVEAEAEASARFGADLYVSGTQFGRPVPIPLEAVDQVRRIDGVTDVTPRIVGEVLLGKEHEEPAILVGLPPEQFAAWADCVDGQLPGPVRSTQPHELIVGTILARRLHLKVGDTYPPFYHSTQHADRLSRIVGVFRPDAPFWQGRLILTPFETAAHVFDQPGLATDLLVSCRPGYQAAVTHAIQQSLSLTNAGGPIHPRVTAREDLLVLLPHGPQHREGIFTLHFILAFVAAILVLLVTSGLGLAERRREIGILKATGWQTDEVLLRGFVESFSLSLAGACVALLLAWIWLLLFNGYGLAGLFLSGAGVAPEFAVPFRLTPVPALLAFVLAFVVVLSGTLYSSWRAATVAPFEAMR